MTWQQGAILAVLACTLAAFVWDRWRYDVVAITSLIVAVVVMAPIAISIAERMEVAPDGFLIAVAIGASCDFLAPFGHHNNTIIMGPGGYRFGDFWRVGLGLDAVVIAVSLLVIPIVWPF